MSNLALRFATAVVAVPVLIAAIRWDNPIGVWALVFAATAAALVEFYQMTMKGEPAIERGVAVVLGLAYAASVYWCGEVPMASTVTLAGATLAAFLFFLFRYREIESVAKRATATLAGFLYVALTVTFIALLKKDLTDGGAWVLVLLTCTWFADTGAYFAGRFLGPYWSTKLYESVSPKKTVVGGLGGLGGSIGALAIAKLWYLPALAWSDVLFVAIPANLLGQMGDLCESLLKRSVGVKDSGKMLPGHGGMLDRIDAVIFAVPYVYFYARWCFQR